MSLSIIEDRVIGVLLADGWHAVLIGDGGMSTFYLDAYEIFNWDWQLTDVGKRMFPGPSGTPPLGATWEEETGRVSCPITSILALRESEALP